MSIEIYEADWERTDDGRFYVFTDVAGIFWPDDYSHSNHDAERRVRERMEAKGCEKLLATWGSYRTPRGTVHFDSESGCFECHAAGREAVEYVVGIIDEVRAELDRAREVLA